MNTISVLDTYEVFSAKRFVVKKREGEVFIHINDTQIQACNMSEAFRMLCEVVRFDIKVRGGL